MISSLVMRSFVSALGEAYSRLFSIGNHSNLWTTNELQSDELVVTTKGGDWFDGGVLIQMHEHSFTPDNGFFNNAWTQIYAGISTCNRLIYQFGLLGTPEAEAFIGELRAIRALWYYWALDSFGNVPLVTDFTDTSAPSNATSLDAGKQAIFDFVEDELLDIIPVLTTTIGGEAYGRINQQAAIALLTKLYLNAEVYTGSARWSDVVTQADRIIDQYSLSADYSSNFAIDNSASPENIFVVPYDKVFAGGFNWPMMMLHYGSQNTYQFTAQPWNGYSVLEEFL